MRRRSAFLLAAVVVLLDQWTKYLAIRDLIPYHFKPIIPMINLTLAYNTGAAFSFLSEAGAWHRWFFAAFSLSMSILLVAWIVRAKEVTHGQLLGLSLILGGALGNLVDRVRLGYVIDFVDVYYRQYHWPVFNLADSAICIGAICIIIDLWRTSK